MRIRRGKRQPGGTRIAPAGGNPIGNAGNCSARTGSGRAPWISPTRAVLVDAPQASRVRTAARRTRDRGRSPALPPAGRPAHRPPPVRRRTPAGSNKDSDRGRFDSNRRHHAQGRDPGIARPRRRSARSSATHRPNTPRCGGLPRLQAPSPCSGSARAHRRARRRSRTRRRQADAERSWTNEGARGVLPAGRIPSDHEATGSTPITPFASRQKPHLLSRSAHGPSR